MRVTMDLRPSRLLVGVGALALAATIGAGFASAGRAAAPATGAPAAPVAAGAIGAVSDTAGVTSTADLGDDAALAAAVDGLSGGGAPGAQAGPRGRALLRAIVGRTERAEITVSTADGQKVVLYVRGTLGAASATSVTVTLKDGTKQAFTLDAATVVRGAGKVRTVADIATAPRGYVLGVRNADGTFTAKFVHLGVAAKQANPAASPAP